MTRSDSDFIDPDSIDSVDALEARYPAARPSSRAKERPALTPAMREWLAHAPFFVLSSVAPRGIDCSPRGDAPGEAFAILDDTRLAIPDRHGNNRIDTLRNLVVDPRVGLVFLVPGAEETLRLRGRATISIAPELLDRFRLDGRRPASVIVVTIEAVWVQNFRAVRRAGLWAEASRVDPATLPDADALATDPLAADPLAAATASDTGPGAPPGARADTSHDAPPDLPPGTGGPTH